MRWFVFIAFSMAFGSLLFDAGYFVRFFVDNDTGYEVKVIELEKKLDYAIQTLEDIKRMGSEEHANKKVEIPQYKQVESPKTATTTQRR